MPQLESEELEPQELCVLGGVRCGVSRLADVAGSEPLLLASLAESCGDDSIHQPKTKTP